MISERDIESVLNRADITDVVERCGVHLGRGNKACCPFHKEKTPSFTVNPRTQTWHCFGGCPQGDNGGDAINFVMKYKQLTFPEAVKDIAKNYGMTIEDETQSAEDVAAHHKRESMFAINKWACQFYERALHANNDKAKFALNYAINGRGWSADYVEENAIGFADGQRDSLFKAAMEAGQPIDLMVELGLIRIDDHGEYYDFYRDRLMIPIRDRFRRVIGFTARALGDSKAKYINSPTSDVYNKKETIFGIDNAIRQARKEDCFYLVEGAPDVIKLQSLGVSNTVASLGGAWSAQHFAELKRHASTVCFIPDADPPKQGEKMGAGKRFVCSNGLIALKSGLGVVVKEIPLSDRGEKQDPDSFITAPHILEAIETKDFVVWYAAIKMIGAETAETKSAVVSEIASLLSYIHDDVKVQMLLKQLQKIYPDKTLWKSALAAAKKANKEHKVSTDTEMLNKELLSKFGFYESKNCYFSIGKDGEYQWSNFTMKPLFHIEDNLMSKRLYRIKNYKGIERIVELKQEDLCSLSKFKVKVESLGNYIWMAKEDHLTKLKSYLYDETESAIEITQLGWQRKGFYAFGNGVTLNGDWIAADEYGIVRLGEMGNYYLPGSSKIYRDDPKLFAFEHKFVHLGLNAISLHDYAAKVIDVFGDNGKVALCFLLATMFRDVIAGYNNNHFPILNLFGPTGSGKTELGISLMSFFIIDNAPPNITNSTIPALSDSLAQSSNATVHIDEFKNDIDRRLIEYLKAVWDGTGRSRMAMKKDEKRETTAVDCGLILSGQEMPTADIALFTRLIFLTFPKNVFSVEADRKFKELQQIRMRGLSHLTVQILRHRAKFEADYLGIFNSTMSDIKSMLSGNEIVERITQNWCMALAAYRTLSGVLDLPMTYKDMLNITVDHIIMQNKECRSNNELAGFWGVVAYLYQDGLIFKDSDFKIKYVNRFKTDTTHLMEWLQPKPVIMLRKSRVFMLYKKNGKMVGDKVLPDETLAYYLENSKEYLGLKKSVRFRNIVDGKHETVSYTDSFGQERVRGADSIDRAYCFDYEMLKQHYNINLEVVMDSDNADEDDKDIPQTKEINF